MGNTPTKDKQQDVYASYIQQQQNLIFKQQNQINELYKFNLQSQQQMPPNMFFQNDINQRQSHAQSQAQSQVQSQVQTQQLIRKHNDEMIPPPTQQHNHH